MLRLIRGRNLRLDEDDRKRFTKWMFSYQIKQGVDLGPDEEALEEVQVADAEKRHGRGSVATDLRHHDFVVEVPNDDPVVPPPETKAADSEGVATQTEADGPEKVFHGTKEDDPGFVSREDILFWEWGVTGYGRDLLHHYIFWGDKPRKAAVAAVFGGGLDKKQTSQLWNEAMGKLKPVVAAGAGLDPVTGKPL